ncbi:MAG: DUF4268 domain-containing protein [Taibaiella sp.]|nr:DUF4268 domain-containing protein [Taibaiella sp.]
MLPTTDTKELQSRYWREFHHYLETNCATLPKCNNAHNTWCNFPLGTSLGTLEAVINTKGSNRVELRIHGKKATETFRKLEMMYKDEFGQQIDKAIWDPMPTRILKRIYVEQSADLYTYEDWFRQFEWLKKNLEAIYSFFRPKLKALGK